MSLSRVYITNILRIHDGDLKRIQNELQSVQSQTLISNLILSEILLVKMQYDDIIDILLPWKNTQKDYFHPLVLYNLGIAYLETENIKEGEKLINEANRIFEEIIPKKAELSLYQELGISQIIGSATLSLHKGVLSHGIDILDKVVIYKTEDSNKKNYKSDIILNILRGKFNIKMGNLVDATIALNKAQEMDISSFDCLRAEVYRNLTIVNLIKGDIDLADSYLEKSYSLFKKAENMIGIANILSLQCNISMIKGNLTAAINYSTDAENIYISSKRKIPLAKLYNNRANMYHNQGNLDLALKYHKLSFHIKDELDDEMGKSVSLLNIGTINSLQSQYNNAMDYYHKALEIQERLGLKRNIALTKLNIGVVYREKGDLDLALQFFDEAFIINEDIGDKNSIARVLQNLASIYSLQSDHAMAFSKYEQSLKIREEIGHQLETADVLYQLIPEAIALDDHINANLYYEKLYMIVERIDNQMISQKLRISEGIIQKSGIRMENKVKAQIIFNKIIDEGILIDQHLVTILHLIDILLDELSLYGEDEVLNEIYLLFNGLQSRAKKENLHALLIESYIFEARLHLINQEVTKANELLTEANNLANQMELTYLVDKTQFELEKLAKYLLDLKNMVDKETTLMDRIKRAQVREYLHKVMKIM